MNRVGAFISSACWLAFAATIVMVVSRPPIAPIPSREPQSAPSAFTKVIETPSFRIHLELRAGRLQARIVEKGLLERVVLESTGDTGLLNLTISRVRFDDRHQSFALEFKRGRECRQQTIDGVRNERGEWFVDGRFTERDCDYPFAISFSERKPKDLEIQARVKHEFEDRPEDIDRDLTDPFRKLLPKFPVLSIHAKSSPSEGVYGAGAQMTHFNQKGKLVPLIVREQGIGRGLGHPLLRGLDLLAPGARGDESATYAPAPVLITSEARAFVMENYEPGYFDLRKIDRVTFAVRSDALKLHVLPRDSVPNALTALTEFTGRMKPLPDWFGQGAILGLQGGSQRALRAVEVARSYDIPVAAVWLQDWVGKRQVEAAGVPIGSFLWWIWEADAKTYPDWPGLVAKLAAKKVSTLSYMNPYLVDSAEKAGAKTNLFAEAERLGYLVRDRSSGRAEVAKVIMFPAALLDLTNERARGWVKEIVKDRIIKSGARGLMADFGEALRFESRISDGNPIAVHNKFPELWARLHGEAAEEAGVGKDFVHFSRSGYLRGPASTRLFWLGDQLTTWDANDGLKSSLIGLLSGGLSGQSLNHSDIGGYTAVAINDTGIRRTKELFLRWTELNAFTTAFRTHEGSRPELNHQFDSDDETLRHFSRFARIFAALAPYRKRLMADAESKGWPLVRPMAFYHARDARVRNVVSQFYLGSDVLVAPVLDSRTSRVRIWLPEGEWTHLLSGAVSKVLKSGWITIEAPLGKPAVYFKARSEFARDFAAAFKEI